MPKNPTALPAHCAHAANALVLPFQGIPMAPRANTASTHTRAKSRGSGCKTPKLGSRAHFHTFVFAKSSFVTAGKATPGGHQSAGFFGGGCFGVAVSKISRTKRPHHRRKTSQGFCTKAFATQLQVINTDKPSLHLAHCLTCQALLLWYLLWLPRLLLP